MSKYKKYIAARKYLLAILLLCFLVPVQAGSKIGHSLRLNFDGGYYSTTPDLASGSIGFDYGWKFNDQLTLFTGMSYWDTEHSDSWMDKTYDYYWENSMVSILVNGSAKFTSPSLRLNRDLGLAVYVEPGASVELLPMAVINYEQVNAYNGISNWEIKTRTDSPYLSWNVKAGFSFLFNNGGYIDLSYFITNMNLYKVYKGMDVDGINLNDLIPSNTKNMNGLRLSIGVNF